MNAERNRMTTTGGRRRGRVGGPGGDRTVIGGDQGGIQLHRRLTRRQMTPIQLSAYRVRKILENFTDTTPELRERYYAELSTFEPVQAMNAELLAAALILLFRTRDNITPQVFANNGLIISVLERLLPNGGANITNPNNDELLTRYKADLLRYIRAILFARSQQGQFIEEPDQFFAGEDVFGGDYQEATRYDDQA